MFNNKVILITGGTGSFGNSFVNNVLKRSNPKKVIIFSRDEFKQYEMAKTFNHKCIRFFLGDVRDYERLKQATRGVDVIIHAAALKHVNSAEYNPEEYVKTNVYGAQNIINAAINNNVQKVISLSTDKASNPINLYGVTKLCADKLMVAANNLSKIKGTKFSVVRYGNVSGSRGSVLPFFKKLVEQKKSFLPITDLNMTRFWITLDQAYNFVCNSILNMKGGEIFVPKLPSIRIIDLANAINKKINKKIVGLQPGEKIHETMFTESDCENIIEYKDYFIIVPSIVFFNSNMNYFKNNSGEKGIKIKNKRDYSSGNNIFLSRKEIDKIINI
jgi:UDP-N-acetylglucosamine 4,6-dehydratase